MTSRMKEAIIESGGWILDFKLFSNASICVSFELPVINVGELRERLAEKDLRLTEESRELLAS